MIDCAKFQQLAVHNVAVFCRCTISKVNIGISESSPTARPSWESGDNVIVGMVGLTTSPIVSATGTSSVADIWRKLGLTQFRFQGRHGPTRPRCSPAMISVCRCSIPDLSFPASSSFSNSNTFSVFATEQQIAKNDALQPKTTLLCAH